MQRKFFGLFLLICLAAPLVYSYVWLHYKQAAIRSEVKERLLAGIDKEELVLLKFSLESAEQALHWEHSREFEYKGQMFDLVQTEIKGDSVFYLCWWDAAESKIHQKIKEMTANVLNTNQEHQDQQNQLNHFYKSLYWAELPEWSMTVPISSKKPIVTSSNSFCHAVLAPPLSPPPELG